MLRCNLAVLLAKQQLTIEKVSQDTGIPSTALTALADNTSRGIPFDTLNKLCMYLKIAPDQLISFVPIDIDVLGFSIKGRTATAEFRVKEGTQARTYYLKGLVIPDDEPSIFFNLVLCDDNSDETNHFIQTLLNIPRPFVDALQVSLSDRIFKPHKPGRVGFVFDKLPPL